MKTRALPFYALALLAACGGGRDTTLAGGSSPAGADGGGPSSKAGPSPSPDVDAGSMDLFTGDDAAAAATSFDCKPGTYAGTFQTQVSSDAGGLASLISFDFKGTLSITVVGTTTQTNGEVPTTTYSIAPGAKLAGIDQTFGGSYAADLTGQLDCAAKTFTGMASDGVYSIFLDAGSLPMQGTLTGTYDDEGGTPTLTGDMTLSSPNVPGLAAVGQWAATLQ
ncbi:MAG TPA: hypothetical protein VHV30_09750 [Polyangiaceae bacterium]|jgi:hypothetical protein|nr:hypothetical protein [Polyangiaceae bacterium]